MNHAGDHETGNHEKDINAHKTAWQRQSGMKGHNEKDRDRSESLDV
jgi:hypothetical protein